jgi:hypothetical protein
LKMEGGGGPAGPAGRYNERGGEAGPSTGGASYAGVEIGEKYAMGAVLGKPGGDRPNRDVGVRNIAERILY